jgi:hypothetical protein
MNVRVKIGDLTLALPGAGRVTLAVVAKKQLDPRGIGYSSTRGRARESSALTFRLSMFFISFYA